MKQNKCFKLDILSSKNRDYDIFVKLTVFLDISKMLVSKFFHWSSWKYLNFWRSKWYRGVLKLSTLYPPSHNWTSGALQQLYQFFWPPDVISDEYIPPFIIFFPCSKSAIFCIEKVFTEFASFSVEIFLPGLSHFKILHYLLSSLFAQPVPPTQAEYLPPALGGPRERG